MPLRVKPLVYSLCGAYVAVEQTGWGWAGAKAVNREDKLSRRYRGRDLAKFERSRRYPER
jgi:hypothetical protein